MKALKKKISLLHAGKDSVWMKEEVDDSIMSQEIIDECLYLID